MELSKHPGDLGRRVAHRRRELGLSRRAIAARAGMAEQYVRCIEEEPAEVPAAALWRLAAALEMTPRGLLGAGPSALGMDHPDGDARGEARR